MPEKSDYNDHIRRRVVVITGSGRGIGRAVALEFAESGYYTMINDLEQEEELKLRSVIVITIELPTILEMFQTRRLLRL
jgi:NAD(P)-dependent dehydrogenase (short-subunit alcohol dehydrogenase family)